MKKIYILSILLSGFLLNSHSQTTCTANWFGDEMGGNSVDFQHWSSGDYSSIVWYFGDGDTSHQDWVVHTYDAPGTYTACLALFDSLGTMCDSMCMDVGAYDKRSVSGMIITRLGDTVTSGKVHFVPQDCATGSGETITENISMWGTYYAYIQKGCYLVYAESTDTAITYTTFPTYYGNTTTWSESEVLVLDSTRSADIVLQTGAEMNGTAKIGGSLEEGDNYGKGPGDPLKGLNVGLSQSNSTVAQTQSDSNGIFTFDNVPAGTYQLYVDLPGVPATPFDVTIGDGETVDNIEGTVNNDGISFKIAGTGFDTKIQSDLLLYPNPANNMVYIQISEPSKLDIVLYNIIGEKVREVNRNINGGEKVKVSLEGLPSGIYTISINDGDKVVNRKLIKH